MSFYMIKPVLGLSYYGVSILCIFLISFPIATIESCIIPALSRLLIGRAVEVDE